MESPRVNISSHADMAVDRVAGAVLCLLKLVDDFHHLKKKLTKYIPHETAVVLPARVSQAEPPRGPMRRSRPHHRVGSLRVPFNQTVGIDSHRHYLGTGKRTKKSPIHLSHHKVLGPRESRDHDFIGLPRHATDAANVQISTNKALAVEV
ncbi:hypothetical protein BJY04DRAFT_163193 [Aspergillus karnatakaensis]|uniref:uncharacterized protein n=1 Tax=Aspergillus karnatakaensis TaxID=1810916 RepID=UPI003CCD7916